MIEELLMINALKEVKTRCRLGVFSHKGYYMKYGSIPSWNGPFDNVSQAEKFAELSGFKADEISWMVDDDKRLDKNKRWKEWDTEENFEVVFTFGFLKFCHDEDMVESSEQESDFTKELPLPTNRCLSYVTW